MEYLDGGNLFEHLQKEGRFSEERSCYYGACLISALETLHNLDIAHRCFIVMIGFRISTNAAYLNLKWEFRVIDYYRSLEMH